MSIFQLINDSIGVTANFPKDGIFFRDISPILTDYKLRETVFDMLADLVRDVNIDYIAGIDSRGFILGIALAQRLKCGFVMLRKSNKIPNTIKIPHDLEPIISSQSELILSLQSGLISRGKNVLVVDDLLASGGSVLAGCTLIEKIGCNVVGCLCLIELFGLSKKDGLGKYRIFSLLKYPANSCDKFICPK